MEMPFEMNSSSAASVWVPLVVDGQRRDEQEAELVGTQRRYVRWSGDAAAVGLQGRVSPASVLESTGAVRDRQSNSVWGDGADGP